MIAEIPWYIPMIASFISLAGFCVAFLAIGRYPVLRDPISARLPNSPAVITVLNLTLFGIFLLAAVLIRWLGKQALVGWRGPGALAAWLCLVTLTFILLIYFERYLPFQPRGARPHVKIYSTNSE